MQQGPWDTADKGRTDLFDTSAFDGRTMTFPLQRQGGHQALNFGRLAVVLTLMCLVRKDAAVRVHIPGTT